MDETETAIAVVSMPGYYQLPVEYSTMDAMIEGRMAKKKKPAPRADDVREQVCVRLPSDLMVRVRIAAARRRVEGLPYTLQAILEEAVKQWIREHR